MSDLAPEALVTLMKQAFDQLTEGRVEEAVETFSTALAIEPHEAGALRGRGLAYLQLKRYSLATADFTAARDLSPDESDNWVDLGISLAMDNKMYPAIDVFETLLARQPECVRGHLELGLLHLRLGAIPRGQAHLQKALACRPTLEQRRLIESTLHEQDTLDKKRYYRPDFEALHQQRQQQPSLGLVSGVRKLLQRLRKHFSRE